MKFQDLEPESKARYLRDYDVALERIWQQAFSIAGEARG